MVAEVVLEVTPDAMDMDAAVAGIVVFQQKGGALDAEILRPLPFQAPGPAKTDLLRPGAGDPGVAGGGDMIRQGAQVGLHDLGDKLLLRAGHIGIYHANRVQGIGPGRVLSYVVGQGPVLEDNELLRLAAKRVDQFQRGIFLLGHGSQARSVVFGHEPRKKGSMATRSLTMVYWRER